MSPRATVPRSVIHYLLGQDAGEEEHVSSKGAKNADRSARHSWHGIKLEAGSHHDLGIRRLVEPDHRVEDLPAVRQMPGASGVL